MLNSGMGADHVISFLSGMDIHPPTAASIYQREKELDCYISEVANESCQEALEEEIALEEENTKTGVNTL